MSNLLVEPPAKNVPKFRPYRGKPFTRAARRVITGGFIPEIQPSTSSGKLRTNSERTIYNLLVENGYDPEIEPFAFKIIRGGSANGRVGWFVPDLYVSLADEDENDSGWKGVYIEVSMAIDLDNKHHKMRFVAEKYGKMVILVSRDNIESFIADPDLLIALISQARLEEFELADKIAESIGKVDSDENHARLNSRMKPRYNREQSARPKKGKRPDPSKVAKPKNKPPRNLERASERRALRKQAKSAGMSITQLRRQSERILVRPEGFDLTVDCYLAKVLPSPHDGKLERVKASPKSMIKEASKSLKKRSSAGPQRIGDRRRNALELSVAA